MLASIESSVIYPVAIIKVNGIKYRVPLDTGSGSSFASEAITDLLKINQIKNEYKTIEVLTTATKKKLNIYSAKIQDLSLPSPPNEIN